MPLFYDSYNNDIVPNNDKYVGYFFVLLFPTDCKDYDILYLLIPMLVISPLIHQAIPAKTQTMLYLDIEINIY